MAKSIPVLRDGELSYKIEIRSDFSDLTAELNILGYQRNQKICVVSDSNVAAFYMDGLKQVLHDTFDTVESFVFEAGEASKNLEVVQNLYEELILKGFDRHDLLIALGGGVVGDLTGFTAATYLRGIDFVQIPTSLLSQVDSSIGGKTGVDFKQYKNMVGAFYMPKLVYMNLSVLKTLPVRQLSSGIGEILKHGLIKDTSYFSWMMEHREAIFALKMDAVEEMIYRSCIIKKNVVENDPTEKGERALLNFGHTIGHAVEKLMNFTMYHGECVAVGTVAAAYISYRQGTISKDALAQIEAAVNAFDLPVQVEGLTAEEILQTTKSDKKMQAGKIKFILLRTIGDAYIYADLTDEQILEGISYILTNCK